MTDLTKLLNEREFKEFQNLIIRWGVYYGLLNSNDGLTDLTLHIYNHFNQEKDGFVMTDEYFESFPADIRPIDEDTVVYWLEKLKPEMLLYKKHELLKLKISDRKNRKRRIKENISNFFEIIFSPMFNISIASMILSIEILMNFIVFIFRALSIPFAIVIYRRNKKKILMYEYFKYISFEADDLWN